MFPAQIQISMHTYVVWSGSTLFTIRIIISLFQSEDPDQTAWMYIMIWIFTDRTGNISCIHGGYKSLNQANNEAYHLPKVCIISRSLHWQNTSTPHIQTNRRACLYRPHHIPGTHGHSIVEIIPSSSWDVGANLSLALKMKSDKSFSFNRT